MRGKLIRILIPVIIGVILLIGFLYFNSLFRNKDAQSLAVSLASFKTNKDSFTNKKQAYDGYLRDSTIAVQRDNQSPNLSALFKSQKKDTLLVTDRVTTLKNKEDYKNNKSGLNKPGLTGKQPRTIKSKGNSFKDQSTSTVLATPQNNLPTQKTREAFFSSSFDHQESVSNSENKDNRSLSAVVHSRQMVYQGSVVKLRTTKNFSFSGTVVPANTFLYGIASISGERVTISVSSIASPDRLIPVNLSVYDKDGIAGIYIPGLAMQDMASAGVKEVVNKASQVNVPVVGNVPVNSLTSRNNQPSAILTDGYKVLLK